jgi:putative transposase
MPLGTAKLTASFKLDGSIPEGLFSTYEEILDQLLDHACAKGITSFKRLKAEKYRELREKYSNLPSHYIYTACQIACHIYKSFRRYRRMKCSECGLEDDRDIIAVKNTRWMQSFRSPRKPSREKRREGMKVNARPERF